MDGAADPAERRHRLEEILRKEREQRAWTVVASIVGAVTVARALPAGDQARAVLDATLKSVIGTIADSCCTAEIV